MQDAFYLDRLYPLQDKVLHLLSDVNSDFYLTGGTALSRHYLHHRYSDDLDFFVNQNSDFQKQTESYVNLLQKNFQVDVQVTGPNYALLFIVDNDLRLKMDFVNDVLFRVDHPINTPLFKRTDHWKNILSNKLSALQRDAAKDIADIILLSENFDFNWRAIVEDASKKDMWINELEIFIARSVSD